VEHDRQLGTGEAGEELLGLAEAVAEEDGDGAGG
jgi:hypothetical protein